MAGNSMLNGSQPVVCAEWIRPAFNRRGGLLRVKRFLALVNYPSYGEAGKVLNVPGAVLGAQVRQLEQALGAPLLIRASMHHPLQLTEAGRRFAEDAREALANRHAAYGS
jgi:LysR family transcriptional regulator, cyn operon transcriptional activator